MPHICYKPKKFGQESLAIIGEAILIIDEYAGQGYDLTLRQLYYQFVARDLIKNQLKEYKRLGDIINDARLAGYIDWNNIVDRTRELESNSHWDTPAEIIQSAAHSFRLDRWERQEYRLEVWVEKEALAGVFERICREMDIAWFSCRGYVSQSELWRAAMRLKGYEEAGQKAVVLHFGDHDPSGIDMTRDIEDRLNMFGCFAHVDRLALSMDQVDQYSPPPNPAKTTDARFQNYLREYGHESWELDALEPTVLADLVRDAVAGYRDEELEEEVLEQEQEGRQLLSTAAGRWPEVVKFLNKKGK